MDKYGIMSPYFVQNSHILTVIDNLIPATPFNSLNPTSMFELL